MFFTPDFSLPDNATPVLFARGRILDVGEAGADGMAEVVISNAYNTGKLVVHQDFFDDPGSVLFEDSTVRVVASQQPNFRWRIRRCELELVTVDAFPIEYCPEDSRKYFTRLVELVQGLVEPVAHAFERILNSRDQYQQFMTLPAGRVCHHTGNGGLLRHTAEVAQFASVMAREMGLDEEHRSLAVGIAICHDFGKLYTQHDHSLHPGVHHDDLTLLACAPGIEYLKLVWPTGANVFVNGLAKFGQQDGPSSPELLVAQAADRLSASLDARARAFKRAPAAHYYKWQNYGGSRRTFLRALPVS